MVFTRELICFRKTNDRVQRAREWRKQIDKCVNTIHKHFPLRNLLILWKLIFSIHKIAFTQPKFGSLKRQAPGKEHSTFAKTQKKTSSCTDAVCTVYK